MSHLKHSWGSFLFATYLIIIAAPSTGYVSAPALDYAEASRFLSAPLQLTREGHVSFQKSQWSLEHDQDGTELFQARKIKAQAARLKGKDGKTEALISYVLKPKKKSSIESSSALFFENGRLAVLTLCEELSQPPKIGRVCITANADVCASLRSEKDVSQESFKKIEAYETRALASILTLRGSDHQLDNMLATGNRLGLKNPLQTTKGQLRALSSRSETDKAAKQVLAHTLPKLKKSCKEARF